MTRQFNTADLHQQMRVRAAFDKEWLLNPAKGLSAGGQGGRDLPGWWPVVPAKAGTQQPCRKPFLDSRLRGNDIRVAAADGEMTHTPTTKSDLCAIVAEARARKAPLAIEGGGTRAGLGRPSQDGRSLSMRALDEIVFYEPAEMVICARAGAPLAQIESMLAERNQILPFEPPDHRRLYGSSGAPTIGAVASACPISRARAASRPALRATA